jgi:hypothetical protein
LSDGLKSRVVFSWLAQKTPHMLLLDERELVWIGFLALGGGCCFARPIARSPSCPARRSTLASPSTTQKPKIPK